jgi:2-keto-4-pentenoate hydratase/2-oxohepta-3-ene-1,7-dioic acid hydratase in catechol pathway
MVELLQFNYQGMDFYRPCGQIIDKELSTPDNPIPKFSPTQALDFELEMATIIGKPSELGERISAKKQKNIFLVLYFLMIGLPVIYSVGNISHYTHF